MSKFAIIITSVVVLLVGAVVIVKMTQPQKTRLGTVHVSQGEKHIQRDEKHEPYNSDPASSGPHYADAGAPIDWGIYTQEIPEEVFLHNEEHGGVIITYKPDLPADQLKSLRSLFASPYKDPKFQPARFILMPRAKNTQAIELASWTRTLGLDTYDENTIKQYYLDNANRGPESGAKPTNVPINQAAGQ